MKRFGYMFLCVALAGCASTEENTAANQANTPKTPAVAANLKEKSKDGMICTMEKKLGSNHRTKVCRLKDNEHDTSIRNNDLMDSLGANR